MSESRDGSGVPKSMRHKRILDVAEQNPDASFEDVAAMVPSATADLVERVLEEYGDPASDAPETPDEPPETPDEPPETPDEPPETPDAPPEATDETVESDMNQDTSDPDRVALSDKELAVLRAIHRDPTATQQEIADSLGVSRATVSRRVNDIEGFEWSNRREFVEQALGSETVAALDSAPDSEVRENGTQPGGETNPEAVREFESRIETLEERLDDLVAGEGSRADGTVDETTAETDGSGPGGMDLDLVHKVVRACMHDDDITEAEERRVLALLFDESESD